MAIITISRGSKSGGQALAECLAEHLHYPLLGREVIQEAAANIGASQQAVDQGMQETPKLWKRGTSTRRVYVTAVQAALAEHIAGGNLVYYGLAGQMLLRGLPAVLRVRLIAPFEVRVRTLMEQEQMDREAAGQYIRDVDDGRRRWVRMMYDQEIADPGLYDLVINLETMSLQSACRLLSRAVRQPRFELTDQVKAHLADFCLACRVRLALLEQADTRALELQVEVRDGCVQLSGQVPLTSTGRIEQRIAEITRGVAGVKDIDSKIQWFGPYP